MQFLAAVPGTFTDLGEHVGTIVALLGVLAIFSVALVKWFASIVKELAINLKDDILVLINKVDGRVNTAFEVIEARRREQAEINTELQRNQLKIREEWPDKFLRVDGPGYKALMDSLTRIEKHADDVAKELRESKKLGGSR